MIMQFPRFFVLFLLVALSHSFSWAAPISDENIKQIFPKATVIGEELADYPVRPVYQLQALLGYIFQTNDLVDLPGFSGDKINLLIGLDIDGNIKGIQILNHHEPIFLHGLGAEPLNNFIAQYPGKNVGNRVIVDKSANDADANDNTVHVDGVTKATVSVIVINDTILLSSIQVARKMLEGFVTAPAATPKQDYQAMSWQTLLENNWVQKWQLVRTDFEEELNASLDDFPSGTFDLREGDSFTLYYAYLNPPSIGRNVLGDEEYRRLMQSLKPTEQAFLFMSEGFFHYLENDFKPGTVANQISLIQGNLPLTMRDLNFYSFSPPTLAESVPLLDDIQLFVVNDQSGFNPSLPMQMSLNITVAKNHLINRQAQFQHDYALPVALFDIAEVVEATKPTPAWVRIWQSKVWVISVLLISLTLVTLIFIYQHKLSANQTLFRYVRWGFMFFTFGFIGWYAQGQLSVVNIFPIIQSLFNGFDISMYLMDPVLFILWIYVFISLFIIGRGIFCGWLCPFGALQEMVGWVAKKLRIRQKKVPYWLHSKLWWIKYAILLALMIISLFSLQTAEVLSEVEPFKTAITLQFIRYWPFVIYTLLLLGAGLFINKFYCRYMCPLGAGLAILGYFHLGEWLTRRKECGSPCTMCHHKCDIKAITPKGDINYNECVQCLECIVYYNNDELCPPLKKANRHGKVIKVVPQ